MIKPILFNTQMVQAILDGRKTTTRRIIKPHYKADEYGFQICTNVVDESDWYVEKTNEDGGGFENTRYINPPYKVGDILYVRETWMISNPMGDTLKGEGTAEYVYKAGYAKGKRVHIIASQEKNLGVWKPSIHMPKEAARIFLKVTDVRVERLQDMNFKDFMSEGIEVDEVKKALYESGVDIEGTRGIDEEVEAFADLWDKTVNKKDIDKYGWNANPWVWVIGFERCEKPNE